MLLLNNYTVYKISQIFLRMDGSSRSLSNWIRKAHRSSSSLETAFYSNILLPDEAFSQIQDSALTGLRYLLKKGFLLFPRLFNTASHRREALR